VHEALRKENAISSEVLRETLTNLEGKEAALVALEAKFNDKVSTPCPLSSSLINCTRWRPQSPTAPHPPTASEQVAECTELTEQLEAALGDQDRKDALLADVKRRYQALVDDREGLEQTHQVPPRTGLALF
jgi:hypothetical protein